MEYLRQFLFKKLNKFNFKYLNTLTFLYIFLVPDHSQNILNGLPLNSKFEITYLILLIIFIITFKNFNFFKKKFFFFILFLLFILKNVIIFYSYHHGIAHKYYFNEKDYTSNKYIKTYNSFWYKNYSSIQERPLINKKDFDIDWTVSNPINKKNYTNKNYYFKNFEEYKNFFSIIVNSSFFLKVDKKFDYFHKISNNNKIIFYKIKDAKGHEFNYKNGDKLKLSNGIYYIESLIKFNGDKWSFNPKLSLDGSEFYEILNKNPYYNVSYYKDIKIPGFINYIIIILSFFLVLILTISFLYFLIKKNKNTILFCLIFYLTYAFNNLIINKFIYSFFKFKDDFKTFPIAVSIIFFYFFYLYFKKFLNKLYIAKDEILEFNLLKSICLFVSIFFLYKYHENLIHFKWWSTGDDWEFTQVFSRQLVVDNLWFSNSLFNPNLNLNFAQEPHIRRWFLRFVFSINHILMGKSSILLIMINIFFICCVAVLIYKILVILNLKKSISFLASSSYLVIILGDNYRWLLDRELPVFYGTILIIYSIFILIKNSIHQKNKFFYKFSLISLITIFFREEYIFSLFGLIFLYYSTCKSKNFFLNLLDFFKKKYKIFLLHLSILISGMFIIILKNFYTFGVLGLNQGPIIAKLNALNLTNQKISYSVGYFDSLYRMLTASDPFNLPRFATIFLLSAFVFSVICIFINSNFNKKNFSLGFIILILSTIFPALIITTINYNPMFTMHYLPISIIMVFYFINLNYFSQKNERFNLK